MHLSLLTSLENAFLIFNATNYLSDIFDQSTAYIEHRHYCCHSRVIIHCRINVILIASSKNDCCFGLLVLIILKCHPLSIVAALLPSVVGVVLLVATVLSSVETTKKVQYASVCTTSKKQ